MGIESRTGRSMKNQPWMTEEWRAARSAATRELWKSPDFSKKVVASMHGGKRSEETKQRIGAATRARWEDRQYSKNIISKMYGRQFSQATRDKISEGHGGFLGKCRPILLRGATAKECSLLMGVPHGSAYSSLQTLRRSGVLKRPTHQEMIAANSRSHILIASKGRNQSLECSLQMASDLCRAGFFSDDLQYWNELLNVYQSAGRQLLDGIADRLRLEVFLGARKGMQQGDRSLMAKYNEIGESVGYQWFDSSLIEEQQFITTHTAQKMNGNGVVRSEYGWFDRARDFYLENGVRWGE